jgi:hypothetical protein
MTTAQAVDLRRTRRAVFGGSFGFFVDMFDVYLPTVALAPAISYFTPKDMPTSTRGIVTALNALAAGPIDYPSDHPDQLPAVTATGR